MYNGCNDEIYEDSTDHFINASKMNMGIHFLLFQVLYLLRSDCSYKYRDSKGCMVNVRGIVLNIHSVSSTVYSTLNRTIVAL